MSTPWLPYRLATPTQQAQALAHAKHRLQQQFPLLTDEQWAHLIGEYKPLLWVSKRTQPVAVEENALLCFANWLHLTQQPEDEESVNLYGREAHYVAQSLNAYVQQAKELLASDPQLAQTASVDEMRALLFRLAAGNSVAERICQVCETSSRVHAV